MRQNPFACSRGACLSSSVIITMIFMISLSSSLLFSSKLASANSTAAHCVVYKGTENYNGANWMIYTNKCSKTIHMPVCWVKSNESDNCRDVVSIYKKTKIWRDVAILKAGGEHHFYLGNGRETLRWAACFTRGNGADGEELVITKYIGNDSYLYKCK